MWNSMTLLYPFVVFSIVPPVNPSPRSLQRVRNYLDSMKIHPDDYEYALKMCRTAVEEVRVFFFVFTTPISHCLSSYLSSFCNSPFLTLFTSQHTQEGMEEIPEQDVLEAVIRNPASLEDIDIPLFARIIYEKREVHKLQTLLHIKVPLHSFHVSPPSFIAAPPSPFSSLLPVSLLICPQSELESPFLDHREYIVPPPDVVFNWLSGTTPETFYPGLPVTCRLLRPILSEENVLKLLPVRIQEYDLYATCHRHHFPEDLMSVVRSFFHHRLHYLSLSQSTSPCLPLARSVASAFARLCPLWIRAVCGPSYVENPGVPEQR